MTDSNVAHALPQRVGSSYRSSCIFRFAGSNLINRGIIPVIYLEELVPGIGSTAGLGDINYTGFVSPAKAGKLIWGVGPAFTPATMRRRT